MLKLQRLRQFSSNNKGHAGIHKAYLDGKEEMVREMQDMNRQLFKTMQVEYGANEPTRRVRVRYAPSPTGFMHIGGLRTALYNYLFAKQHGGDFLLRIEDTDKKREVDGSIDDIVKMMKWAGLTWDEGPGSVFEQTNPGKQGKVGPYLQSERLPVYQKFVNTLMENGDAYPCFCSTERLADMRVEIGGAKYAKAKYDRRCTHLSKQEADDRMESGESYIIRMKIPTGITSFKDIVHGKVIFENKTIDDQVILKNDGYPTYHLANVIDDYLMGISHVIRGEVSFPDCNFLLGVAAFDT